MKKISQNYSHSLNTHSQNLVNNPKHPLAKEIQDFNQENIDTRASLTQRNIINKKATTTLFTQTTKVKECMYLYSYYQIQANTLFELIKDNKLNKRQWISFVEFFIINQNINYINWFINSIPSCSNLKLEEIDCLILNLRMMTVNFIISLIKDNEKKELKNKVNENPALYGLFVRSQILNILSIKNLCPENIYYFQKEKIRIDAYLATYYVHRKDLESTKLYLSTLNENITEFRKNHSGRLFENAFSTCINQCKKMNSGDNSDPAILEYLNGFQTDSKLA